MAEKNDPFMFILSGWQGDVGKHDAVLCAKGTKLKWREIEVQSDGTWKLLESEWYGDYEPAGFVDTKSDDALFNDGLVSVARASIAERVR